MKSLPNDVSEQVSAVDIVRIFFLLKYLRIVFASVQVNWPVFNRANNTQTNSRRKLGGKERNMMTGGAGWEGGVKGRECLH